MLYDQVDLFPQKHRLQSVKLTAFVASRLSHLLDVCVCACGQFQVLSLVGSLRSRWGPNTLTPDPDFGAAYPGSLQYDLSDFDLLFASICLEAHLDFREVFLIRDEGFSCVLHCRE